MCLAASSHGKQFWRDRTSQGRRCSRATKTDVALASAALSLFARLEALNRRIATPPQCQIDPLQHNVVDFETLLEGDNPSDALPA
jgi:hypothetical protein